MKKWVVACGLGVLLLLVQALSRPHDTTPWPIAADQSYCQGLPYYADGMQLFCWQDIQIIRVDYRARHPQPAQPVTWGDSSRLPIGHPPESPAPTAQLEPKASASR